MQAIRERWFDAVATKLLTPDEGKAHDFSQPPGEAALVPHDSVSWQLFKNPVALFVGGIAAVVLELAEPRVRTGVWEYTSFREYPMRRLQRTARAAMITVYAARRDSEAMIARVVRKHGRIAGVAPNGQPFRADDVELLDWVHATASFGIVEATHAYVRPLSTELRDRAYAEGEAAARLFGALGAPTSQAQIDALLESQRGALEASNIVHEFLSIMRHAPVLPAALQPMQNVFVDAGIAITPEWVRERLGLAPILPAWKRKIVRSAAAFADRLVLVSSPAVCSCRRLGLPDDYLFT